jgi:hypothetical protein
MGPVPMNRGFPAIAIAMLAIVLAPACRTGDPKKKNRYEGLDGGRQLLPECDKPTDDCFVRCDKREASDACNGCCWDQRLLCDTHQPFSFESCDGAK